MEIRPLTEADRPRIIPEDPQYKREGERLRRLRGMLRVARNRGDSKEVERITALLDSKA
jgi:hypothetical protein